MKRGALKELQRQPGKKTLAIGRKAITRSPDTEKLTTTRKISTSPFTHLELIRSEILKNHEGMKILPLNTDFNFDDYVPVEG